MAWAGSAVRSDAVHPAAEASLECLALAGIQAVLLQAGFHAAAVNAAVEVVAV